MNAERAAVNLYADPSCPICTGRDAAPFALATDRLFGTTRASFRLYRCSLCGCVFQHPLPDSMALDSFYPREYWWSEGRRSGVSRILNRLERAYREFVALDHVRFLEHCVPGGGRSLLDIGCGSGTFLHLARRHGFLPHGIDVSSHAVAAARRQYDLPVRQGDIGSDVWKGHCFDVITMFHVLEHLPDPHKALVAAGELLHPGGSLIVQVPNAASFQARLFGARWYGFDVPRHVINFTPRSLSLLLTGTGFSCRLTNRFSLRDNPAALASSLAVGIDPIGRRGRGKRVPGPLEGTLELVYLCLVLLALPPALLESWCGRGATLWAHARRATESKR